MKKTLYNLERIVSIGEMIMWLWIKEKIHHSFKQNTKKCRENFDLGFSISWLIQYEGYSSLYREPGSILPSRTIRISRPTKERSAVLYPLTESRTSWHPWPFEFLDPTKKGRQYYSFQYRAHGVSWHPGPVWFLDLTKKVRHCYSMIDGDPEHPGIREQKDF